MLTVGIGLLVVSAVSLIVQGSSLIRILRGPKSITKDQRLANHGLIRTAVTRVTASVLYIAVAIRALYVPEDAAFSLFIFTIVQLMWQANALSDVRLRRRLSVERKSKGRHRRE